MVTAELDEILDRYGRDRTQIISILQDVQERERYLPEEALTYVAQALEMPGSTTSTRLGLETTTRARSPT